MRPGGLPWRSSLRARPWRRAGGKSRARSRQRGIRKRERASGRCGCADARASRAVRSAERSAPRRVTVIALRGWTKFATRPNLAAGPRPLGRGLLAAPVLKEGVAADLFGYSGCATSSVGRGGEWGRGRRGGRVFAGSMEGVESLCSIRSAGQENRRGRGAGVESWIVSPYGLFEAE